MSKVYSFRLDENNPREAQAREMIETRVSKGFSLRQVVVDTLISCQSEDRQNSDFEEILEKITRLLETTNEGGESVKAVQETLPETFVGAISKSVKSGIRME